MSSPGQIPQSNALAEAQVESLSELMSRDPEGYSRQDRTRIIEALRQMRAKWEASELEAQAKPKGRAAKATETQISTVKIEDLGL